MIAAVENFSEQSSESIIAELGSNKESGLTHAIAEERLKTEGPNEFRRSRSVSAWSLLVEQFRSSVVLLLVFSAIVSAAMHEYLQTLGIVAALVINAAVGFVTEYRANISLDALSKLAGSTIRVRRSDREIDLPVRELVRGDILLLESGVRVPADLQLLESANFSVDESLLTGESLPVWKTATPQPDDSPESARVFQGSAVLSGRSICIVLATGAATKIGKLGLSLSETVSGATPLTRSLNVLGQQLTTLVVLLSVAFGLLGLLRHLPFERMLQTSIALAVAAIPEGLPVIATLALAAGIKRMIKAKAVVRRLPAVETLGCTTVICTDKTGTLTENKMLVTDIVLNPEHLQLSGRGYDPTGKLTTNGAHFEPGDERLHEFLTCLCLCNDARLENHGGEEGWHIHGDPTEGCLITAALKLGENDEALRDAFPRLAELPFDLNRKRMSTIHFRPQGGCTVFCKGSVEAVLPLCTRLQAKNGAVEFGKEQKDWFMDKNFQLARHGLRVLAVAVRTIEAVPDDLSPVTIEHQLTFLGLVAMADRPKENVEQAIKSCQTAGIRVLMLTGDQPATAGAVAHELGISANDGNSDGVLTGAQLAALNDGEINSALDKACVLARVTPEMKLDIVKRLQNKGHVVAMTGDGMNDALALRQSNIGVAMGQSGTDMAREASDLVITDDNFATIVKAVEQGRITYDNISRAVGYLLTASLASVLAVIIGVIANAGLLFEPLQLLYLNLIMHIFPGLGIVLQKQPAGVMLRSPRDPEEPILNGEEQRQIVVRGILVVGFSLIAVIVDQHYYGAGSATTVGLAALSLSLIFQSWSWLAANVRGKYSRLAVNAPMLLCTALSVLLLIAAIYVAPFRLVLNTVPLNHQHMYLVLGAAVLSFLSSLPLKLSRQSG